MKSIILMAGLTLLTASAVQSQTLTDGIPTRKQTLQKSNVLRKKATPQPNNYHANSGNRTKTIHSLTASPDAPRTQPIVTKPLPPVQTQP